jgi:hypothetical protein
MLLAAASAMPLVAEAAEMSTKAEITAAVSDKTYQGSMLKDAFAEYYAPDGTIKGKNYSGKWRATDGTMCFQYGDKPEKCWDVRIEGPSMTMYRDGKVDGNGMLVDGNPNKF